MARGPGGATKVKVGTLEMVVFVAPVVLVSAVVTVVCAAVVVLLPHAVARTPTKITSTTVHSTNALPARASSRLWSGPRSEYRLKC